MGATIQATLTRANTGTLAFSAPALKLNRTCCRGTDLLISSRSPPLWGEPRCSGVCCRSPHGHRSWVPGGSSGTETPPWTWPCRCPGPAAAPSRTEPGEGQEVNPEGSEKHLLDRRSAQSDAHHIMVVCYCVEATAGRALTFLCTSVRIRYSADRSSLAFRLGKTDEFNRSGENLPKQEQDIKNPRFYGQEVIGI